jgi:hypothetical protein
MFPPFWNNHTDKVLHFLFGGVIYIVAGFGFHRVILWLASLPHLPQVLGALAVVFFAVGKEFYDMTVTRRSDAFDWWDIGFTLLGAAVFGVLFMLLQLL